MKIIFYLKSKVIQKFEDHIVFYCNGHRVNEWFKDWSEFEYESIKSFDRICKRKTATKFGISYPSKQKRFVVQRKIRALVNIAGKWVWSPWKSRSVYMTPPKAAAEMKRLKDEYDSKASNSNFSGYKEKFRVKEYKRYTYRP